MKNLFILVLAVAAFGCSGVKVSYDYDQQSDFTKYKTYYLSDEAKALPIQQLNRNRILTAVDTQMAVKGFSKVDSTDADIIVDVHLVGKQLQTATATTSGYGGGYGRGYGRYAYGGGYSTTQINYDQYTEGTMLITFIDIAQKQIIWQGKGTKILAEDVSTEKREKNINYSVEKIINNYPPEIK